MAKYYEWGEIKSFLIKELKKTRHIMTFGTIGSCNVNHDIDIIITKKSNSPTSEFYKEVHILFDSLNNYLLGKYNAKAIRFSQYKADFETLLKSGSKDLLLHVMIYTNYPQIEKDWGWFLLKDESLKVILSKYNCLIGSLDDLNSKEFLKESYYDPVFLLLYLYDRINSGYSESNLVNVMNSYYDQIYRKKLNIKPPVAKNEKEVRKYFYKLCDILDNLEKKKSK